VVQDDLSKKQDSISKITRAKRTGDMAQVVECLLSKREVLSSNPNITTKEKKKKKEKEGREGGREEGTKEGREGGRKGIKKNLMKH
jgi:predicted transposase YdaD